MHLPLKVKNDACVFFARDFLSIEFPTFGESLSRYERVYVVSNQTEANRVKQHDPNSHTYSLSDMPVSDDEQNCEETSFNNDRYLRYYDKQKINKTIEVAHCIVSEIVNKFNVKYYLDEPVSGFINDYFNRSFRDLGTICLHFHFAWVPGYIFFTQDSAQREPFEAYCLEDMASVVTEHVSNRNKGKERPRYVIGYESRVKVLLDACSMFAMGMYRKIFRQGELYIDSDPSPHFFHALCLLKSLYSSYGNLPSIDDKSKYVVLPLHYEPEAVINYFSKHRRQVEIAERLIDTLPSGFKLVIKEHPSQPGALAMSQWRNVVKCSRVISLRAQSDTRKLFSRQIYVVSIGSTFALEAAVHGIPVAVLGGVHFAKAPNIIEIQEPEDWIQLLELKTTQNPDTLIEWYSTFMARYCVKGCVMRDKTDMSMVASLID